MSTPVVNCPVPATAARMHEIASVSVAEVLETMFFSEATPGFEPGDRPSLVIAVDFRGTPSGCLWLRIGAEAADLLAASFLGLEASELSQTSGLDTAFELANMICGSVLSRVESDSAFELAPPRRVEGGEAGAPREYLGFTIDGGSLEVAFCL